MKFRKTALALAAMTATASLFFTIGTFSSSSDANASTVRGDVNEDGNLNILDLISLKNLLLGIDKPEETPSTTVEETTILFEETKYDEAVTEAPQSTVFEDTNLDVTYKLVSKESIYGNSSIPTRSQIIKSKEEYSTYLKELTVSESVSNVILSNRFDFDKYYLGIVTVYIEESTVVNPKAVISENSIDLTYLENNVSIKNSISHNSYINSPGTYLFEIKIPKDLYNGQEITFETALIPIAIDLPVYYKPVIYLYPEKTTDINVKLTLDGELKYTYPEYPQNGWNVTATPDSVLHDASGREYSYLFWEGTSNCKWDMSEGFVVKGSDTVAFLQEKLEYLGLTPKEYNDFIVFWLPKMQDNNYNLISFQTDLYEKSAQLDITPKPDSIQRVFMAFKPLDKYEEVPEQKLEPFTRHGYSVIEWGGTEIGKAENTAY